MNFPGAAAALAAFNQARKGDTVSEEEIMRRAAICKVCPKRKKTTGVRSRISRQLGIIANRNKVPDELRNYSCGVCDCSLMLLAPSVEGHADSDEQLADRPDTCWMMTPEKIAKKATLPPPPERPMGGCSTCGG